MKTGKIYTSHGAGCTELSPKFCGALIDAVEDFLEAHGIKPGQIDDPATAEERTEYVKDSGENPAIIFAGLYDELAEELLSVIKAWIPPTRNNTAIQKY